MTPRSDPSRFVGPQPVGWSPETRPHVRPDDMPAVRCGVCMNNPQGYSTVPCPRGHAQPTVRRPPTSTDLTPEEVAAAWNAPA